MLKTFIFFIAIFGLWFATPALAGNLIKSASNPAVYYLDEQNIRHLFPTGSIYKTWYNNFFGLKILTLPEISNYPIGKNVTVRPGQNIMVFETDVNLYAVEPGGILRRFANLESIKGIYGATWPRRVIKLPDSLFNDYRRGDDIREAVELPHGLVYKLTNDGKYYYKKNNLLWPFKDLKSITDNNFKSTDHVSSSIEFNKRKKEISGFDANVFNPVEKTIISTADCENKKFRVAFLFITDGREGIADLEKIKTIKNRLAENFKWASQNLASANVDYVTVVLKNEPKLFYQDAGGKNQVDNEAINIFYDQNPDTFDFIVLYNNFVADELNVANYLKVTNNFTGTGNGEMDASQLFGSHGKLKGVANMGNLNKYSVENEDALNQSVNYVLHEIAHHFSARARFKDSSGNINTDLLTGQNFDHWSKYLISASPLGGAGWADNGNGTFTNGALLDPSLKKKFSDLDLYFMGLLPKPFVAPIKYIVPDKVAENVISGKLREVTIDQITEAMGDWRCTLEKN